MAGTREGLELRAAYSWQTEPLYLLTGDGIWAERNVPRAVVFGTELETIDGGKRTPIVVDSITYNTTQSRLELEFHADLNPTNDDLVFNRLSIIRGGKQQGTHTGSFDANANTFTISSAIPEPWAPGDKFVVHGSFEAFTVDTVSGSSGEILTLVEDVSVTASNVIISDATGAMMVNYVFVQEALVFQNATTRISVSGYSFAG